MRGRYVALSILALGCGIAGGVFGERFYSASTMSLEDTGPEILYWVAPMDANFRQPGPGKSPMGMDLIPVYAGEEKSGDPSEVKLSAVETNSIGVRTATARIDEISQRIETVGFVRYNEHNTSHVHTRVNGWIEKLNVRAVGDRVEEGDLLFEMFAPEFAVAVTDIALYYKNDDPSLQLSARNKLRSHGASEKQINAILNEGKSTERLEVYAPRDGVVIGLTAADGMYLQPNTLAVSLTDLSSVWLVVDVFERDIARLSEDMTAYAKFEHLPGVELKGTIDYIYPELDATTRTLPVRLQFDNRDGLLRPNMFGEVSLEPNVTKRSVTIPSEAVIRTGTAERVILKTADGMFIPRLVTTGLNDSFGEGARTEIVQGLAPGDVVVASAQFLIDSESSLSAGLMRMAPTEQEPVRGKGVLVAFDAAARTATIRHDQLEMLGWPAMETRFPLRAAIFDRQLILGEEVAFSVVRDADGVLALTELGPDNGIAATGIGMVQAVTADGKLTVEHEPIPELGWPAMKMDMDVAGVDVAAVPLNAEVEFDLAKDDGGMFSIVAVRTIGQESGAKTRDMAKAPEVTAAPKADAALSAPILVSGQIEKINPDTGMATISHGPIKEIGMPGMTMDFAISDALDPVSLPLKSEAMLTFERPDGMTMVLASVAVDAPPMRVSGIINSVDPDTRTVNISHGPMVEIGMPGMTMDFVAADTVMLDELPKGRELPLLMRKNPDFSLTLLGVEAVGIELEMELGQ